MKAEPQNGPASKATESLARVTCRTTELATRNPNNSGSYRPLLLKEPVISGHQSKNRVRVTQGELPLIDME